MRRAGVPDRGHTEKKNNNNDLENQQTGNLRHLLHTTRKKMKIPKLFVRAMQTYYGEQIQHELRRNNRSISERNITRIFILESTSRVQKNVLKNRHFDF